MLLYHWVYLARIEGLLGPFKLSSRIWTRYHDVSIAHGSQLRYTFDLEIGAHDKKDDAAERESVNVGRQAVATAMGDDILSENGPH